MELWIWRNFRLRMPGDWEMLQFTRDSRAGRCAFADRYQFRLEFTWRMVENPPDFDRILSDYHSQLQERSLKNVQYSRHGAWRGIGGEGPEGLSTRFGRHFPGESCLIELVFLWPDGHNRALEREVLDSVAEEAPHAGGARRWRAFGMDLLASPGLALARCTVEPAHAELSFADAAGIRRERFARRGMVGEWLRDPLRNWLRSTVPPEVSVSASSVRAVAAHGVESVSGELRRAGLPGLLGRRLHYKGEAWICPADGRLYTVSRIQAPGDASAAGGLRCCAGMQAAGGLA